MLSKLPPFFGDPRDKRAFINLFLLQSSRCNNAQKRSWFQKLAGSSYFLFFESGSCLIWAEMETAFLASFTVRYKETKALPLSCTPPQGADKTVV